MAQLTRPRARCRAVGGAAWANPGKNDADICLCIDAMGLLQQGQFSTFLLISGDGGLVPLVRKVQEHGNQVVGASLLKSAAARLQRVCDEFYDYDHITADDASDPAPPARRQQRARREPLFGA